MSKGKSLWLGKKGAIWSMCLSLAYTGILNENLFQTKEKVSS